MMTTMTLLNDISLSDLSLSPAAGKLDKNITSMASYAHSTFHVFLFCDLYCGFLKQELAVRIEFCSRTILEK